MPPISDEFRGVIWIISGVSAAFFGVLTVILETNIVYFFRTKIPGEEKRGRPPKERSVYTWGLYFLSGFISIASAAVASSAPRLVPLTPMTGDFRIAVAGFAVTGQAAREGLGIELAEGVQLRLAENLSEVNPGLIITIWGPDRVGSLEAIGREDRAHQAMQLAEKIGADMVVYGAIDTLQPFWRVIPEFYIAGENFFEAQEIVGQHDLGSAFPLIGQDNIAGRITLGEEMTPRVQLLSKITVGLAYYAIHRYEDALEHFLSTESIEGMSDELGRQVVYLLIGNAAGKWGEVNLAERYYQKALDIDPEYARAYVGLGSVAYFRALEPFEQSNDPQETDLDRLDLAIQRYERALSAAHQPALADIGTKVHFGLGQCYFMRAYSGSDPWFDPAIAEFKQVIEAYDDGANPRVRELAAESHARLGLIFDLSGATAQAVEEYEIAASLLLDHPDRQSLYLSRAEALRTE